MERPFFSLAKAKRLAPIDYRRGDIWVRVEALQSRGMATIWDADILLWAGSQLVEAQATYGILLKGESLWIIRAVASARGDVDRSLTTSINKENTYRSQIVRFRSISRDRVSQVHRTVRQLDKSTAVGLGVFGWWN